MTSKLQYGKVKLIQDLLFLIYCTKDNAFKGKNPTCIFFKLFFLFFCHFSYYRSEANKKTIFDFPGLENYFPLAMPIC